MDEQDYLDFLIEVSEAIANSNADPKVVYPLLQANLDKLDNNFVKFLQTLASAKLSEAAPEKVEYIANTFWYFSALIQQFPIGNKANNMEIAITGYKEVLKVLTSESNPESWAAIQNNLGLTYSTGV